MSRMCFLATVMPLKHGSLVRGTVHAVAKHLGGHLHQVGCMPKTGMSSIKRTNLSIRWLPLLDDPPAAGHVHPISEVSGSAARAVTAFLESTPMQELATVLQATRHCTGLVLFLPSFCSMSTTMPVSSMCVNVARALPAFFLCYVGANHDLTSPLALCFFRSSASSSSLESSLLAHLLPVSKWWNRAPVQTVASLRTWKSKVQVMGSKCYIGASLRTCNAILS
jgi:hypothetical protein